MVVSGALMLAELFTLTFVLGLFSVAALVAGLAALLGVPVVVSRGGRVVRQATARVCERFGRFQRVLEPGLNLVVPFVDQLRPSIDLREQVVTFPPQQVITKDNLVVGIDTVIYFQVTDAKAAKIGRAHV